MAYPWFRLYSEMLSDRKLARAARLAGCERATAVGVWVGMMCLASESSERGRLLLAPGVPFSGADIAEEVGCGEETVAGLLDAFARLEMVAWQGDALAIVGWRQQYAPVEVRSQSGHAAWRREVFARDNYTCQKCGKRGVKLQAHHTRPWFLYDGARYDVTNGVTLCVRCHRNKHRRGWKQGGRRPSVLDQD